MMESRLAVVLAQKGLRISKVSQDTGISRTTLTALVHNKCKGIQFDTLDTLCAYFGVPVEEILVCSVENNEGPCKKIKAEMCSVLRPCIDTEDNEKLLFHHWVYGDIALCEREDGTMTQRGHDRIKFLDTKHEEYSFLYNNHRKEDGKNG